MAVESSYLVATDTIAVDVPRYEVGDLLTPREVSGLFVRADLAKPTDEEAAAGVISPARMYELVNSARASEQPLSPGELRAQSGGLQWSLRDWIYSDAIAEVIEVSASTVGVWPGAAGLPAEWTTGSVVETAHHLAQHLNDPVNSRTLPEGVKPSVASIIGFRQANPEVFDEIISALPPLAVDESIYPVLAPEWAGLPRDGVTHWLDDGNNRVLAELITFDAASRQWAVDENATLTIARITPRHDPVAVTARSADVVEAIAAARLSTEPPPLELVHEAWMVFGATTTDRQGDRRPGITPLEVFEFLAEHAMATGELATFAAVHPDTVGPKTVRLLRERLAPSVTNSLRPEV